MKYMCSQAKRIGELLFLAPCWRHDGTGGGRLAMMPSRGGSRAQRGSVVHPERLRLPEVHRSKPAHSQHERRRPSSSSSSRSDSSRKPRHPGRRRTRCSFLSITRCIAVLGVGGLFLVHLFDLTPMCAFAPLSSRAWKHACVNSAYSLLHATRQRCARFPPPDALLRVIDAQRRLSSHAPSAGLSSHEAYLDDEEYERAALDSLAAQVPHPAHLHTLPFGGRQISALPYTHTHTHTHTSHSPRIIPSPAGASLWTCRRIPPSWRSRLRDIGRRGGATTATAVVATAVAVAVVSRRRATAAARRSWRRRRVGVRC